jgi:hypothetical protein
MDENIKSKMKQPYLRIKRRCIDLRFLTLALDVGEWLAIDSL